MSEKMDLNKIQKIMDKRGWSLDAIGEKLGITQEELASVEEPKIEDPKPTETPSEKVEEPKETEKVPEVKVEQPKVEEPKEETRVTKVDSTSYDKQIADLLKENATLKESMASQNAKLDKVYEMLKAQGTVVNENKESYATYLGASPYPNFSKSANSPTESYGDLLGK